MNKSRGFTLTEALFALTLLTTAAVATSKFLTMLKINHTLYQEYVNALNYSHSEMEKLRHDNTDKTLAKTHFSHYSKPITASFKTLISSGNVEVFINIEQIISLEYSAGLDPKGDAIWLPYSNALHSSIAISQCRFRLNQLTHWTSIDNKVYTIELSALVPLQRMLFER